MVRSIVREARRDGADDFVSSAPGFRSSWTRPCLLCCVAHDAVRNHGLGWGL